MKTGRLLMLLNADLRNYVNMICDEFGRCDVKLWDFRAYPPTRWPVTERTVRHVLRTKKVVIMSQEEGETIIGLPRTGSSERRPD